VVLSDHLVPYLEILRTAFPATPVGEQLSALLRVLFGDMSEETFGDLLAEYLDEERVVVINNAVLAVTCNAPDHQLDLSIRLMLEEHGWEFDSEDD
jgi:hypothetical protein